MEHVPSNLLILAVLSLYPLPPLPWDTQSYSHSSVGIWCLFFYLEESEVLAFCFLVIQKAWAMCGLICACDDLNVFLFLFFGTCIESFRFRPFCYLAMKLRWSDWTGMGHKSWGKVLRQNLFGDAFATVRSSWPSYSLGPRVQIRFLLQVSILILGFDLIPLGSDPCFSNVSNIPVPQVRCSFHSPHGQTPTTQPDPSTLTLITYLNF